MKNALMIAAANALGHALLNLLLEKEIRTTAVIFPLSSNKNAVPINPLINLIECNVSDLASLENILIDDYDTLFYLDDSEDKFHSAQLTAELAIRLNCGTFIGVGSQAELYPFDDVPYGSEMLAAGKLCAAKCQSKGLRFSWFRLSNLYGAYDHEDSFVSANVLSLLTGGGLLLPEEGGPFDLISAEDAAQALFSAAENPESKPFYDLISGDIRPATAFAKNMTALICPSRTPGRAIEPSLSLHKNGPDVRSEFIPSLSFKDGLAFVIPWAQEVLEERKKLNSLCNIIFKLAITQYNSGDLNDSLKRFFKILDFKKNLYHETLNSLAELFAEPNKDFYRDNFGFNLNYFALKSLTDFNIESDDNFRLYYTDTLIRLHDIEHNRHWDLIIQDTDGENPPEHLQVTITYAGIIIDCDETFVQSLNYAKKYYSDRDIYVMASSLHLLIAYMQIMKFNEAELRLIKIFSSAAEMEAYFRSQPKRCLPKSIISRDKNLCRKLLARLDRISVYRRGIPRENSDSIILTIAIPSYMRAKTLLKNIRHLLSLKRDIEFEVYVAINDWPGTSAADPESAAEIEAIQDSRLRILKRPKNITANRNFVSVIAESHGKYSFITSDEDFVNLDKFDYIIQRLSDFQNVAVYRMAGEFYGRNYTDVIYKKGAEALAEFNYNTYITGAVYNLDLLARSRAVERIRYFFDRWNKYCAFYTLPVLDMYMSLMGDIVVDSTIGYIDPIPVLPEHQQLAKQGIAREHADPHSRIRQYDDYTEILLDVTKDLNYEINTVYKTFSNFTLRNFFLFSCIEHILINTPEGIDYYYILLLEFTRDKIKRFNQEYFPLIGLDVNSKDVIQITKSLNDSVNKTVLSYLKDKEKYASYFE